MQAHQVHPNPLVQYGITAAIVLVVLAIRLRRMSRTRRLRLEMLWVVPAIYLVVAAIMFYEFPPAPIGWAISALALLIGGALGWQRGKLMHIAVDPATHALNQKASPAALIFIVILIGVRQVARVLAQDNPAFHPYAGLVTNVLIALGLGLFTVMRVEMYLRARRLLDEARGGVAA